MELRATVHHLGDIVAAGVRTNGSDGGSSSDSGMGGDLNNFNGFGMGKRGGGGGGGKVWGEYSSDDDDDGGEWGVEYAWSAQGGAGRHQGPTLADRMPQAICTNYLRVNECRHLKENEKGGGRKITRYVCDFKCL